MNNWMLKLEERMDKEDAQLVVHLVAGTIMLAAIVIGNWHLIA